MQYFILLILFITSSCSELPTTPIPLSRPFDSQYFSFADESIIIKDKQFFHYWEESPTGYKEYTITGFNLKESRIYGKRHNTVYNLTVKDSSNDSYKFEYEVGSDYDNPNIILYANIDNVNDYDNFKFYYFIPRDNFPK